MFEKHWEDTVKRGVVIDSMSATIDVITQHARPVHLPIDGAWDRTRDQDKDKGEERKRQEWGKSSGNSLIRGMTKLNAYAHRLTTRPEFSSVSHDDSGTTLRNKR